MICKRHSGNKKEPALKDTDKMPFGKYKDSLMQDVPPRYLMWLYEEIRKQGITRQNELVFNYIHNSMDAIQMELKL